MLRTAEVLYGAGKVNGPRDGRSACRTGSDNRARASPVRADSRKPPGALSGAAGGAARARPHAAIARANTAVPRRVRRSRRTDSGECWSTVILPRGGGRTARLTAGTPGFLIARLSGGCGTRGLLSPTHITSCRDGRGLVLSARPGGGTWGRVSR